MLVARIVVDVDCDAAQGGHFGGERGEGVVVLSGRWCEIGSSSGGFEGEGGLTFRARRLRTWLWWL